MFVGFQQSINIGQGGR